MAMTSGLQETNMLYYSYILSTRSPEQHSAGRYVAHPNKLSWLRANQSLILLLNIAEKRRINNYQ